MRKRDKNKEELVRQNALEMLVHKGIEGFSMKQLARECDISVATLYIYYTDKDDLVIKIGTNIGNLFFTELLQDFSPEMQFKEGLRKQWENIVRFAHTYPLEDSCYELLRHSTYGESIFQQVRTVIPVNKIMDNFYRKAIKQKEIKSISKYVYMNMAYGQLYTLLKFQKESTSLYSHPFVLTQETLEEAFELVISALSPPTK